MAELTYSQAFQQGMREEMERNDHIFVTSMAEHLVRLTWYVVDMEEYLANLKALGRIYRVGVRYNF